MDTTHDRVFGPSRQVFYMEPEELKSLLEDPAKKETICIVDVRDNDFDNNVIASPNVYHIPSCEMSPEAVDRAFCRGKGIGNFDIVVCHCMFSQSRGPKAAKYIEELFPSHKFVIFVLAGGFSTWRSMYPELVAPYEF